MKLEQHICMITYLKFHKFCADVLGIILFVQFDEQDSLLFPSHFFLRFVGFVVLLCQIQCLAFKS